MMPWRRLSSFNPILMPGGVPKNMRRIIPFLFLLVVFLMVIFAFILVPIQVERNFGQASSRLTLGQRYTYALRLFWHDGLLTRPSATSGQSFTVTTGEPTYAIAQRLEQAGIILNAGAFLDYLTFTGLDTTIQAGRYEFEPFLSMLDVARIMQDLTPLDVTFVILPGWRMEEIAGSLPSSGLQAEPNAFLISASTPGNYPFLAGASSNEGFLYPDTYILPRATDASGLVDALLRNFYHHLTPELETGFSDQNLTVFQAVILASIVERESVKNEEMPLIASVFLNRLSAGWKLDSDPTVQYSVGYDGNWWPVPLTAFNLENDSPYNTYLYMGLPPAPISNPSQDALNAVAHPAMTNNFFFQARCDGSGWHNFAETIEEHINNGCD